jgi:hypothetical protein
MTVQLCEVSTRNGEPCKAPPCARIDGKLVCYAHTKDACREANQRLIDRWNLIHAVMEDNGYKMPGVIGV